MIFNCLFQFYQEQLLQNGKEEDISTITLKGNLPSIVTCRFRHVYRRRDFSGFKIIPDLLHLGLPDLRAFTRDTKDSPDISKI